MIDESMHIGFLTPEYPHPRLKSAAGIGTSIKNMSAALTEKGVKVSLFIYGQSTNDFFTEGGIKFHLIKQRQYKFLGWYLYRKHLQNYINEAIIHDKIGAIEAPDWTGITAFMNLKCPLVIRLHGCDAYFCHLENRKQKKKNFWFEKKALEGADYLLSVSKFTAIKTGALFGLKKKIKVIPNSVDITYFTPNIIEIVPNTLLYFGSIIRKKGVLELAKIFNLVVHKNPKARLIFVGRDIKDYKTGKSTSELIKEILDSSALKKVSWLGSLTYEEVKVEIAKARVITLPSFAEALPMTWIESMSMQKALVTSNIGWAEEIMINGKTGFTISPENHLLYADCIIRLLDNPELSLKMGISARKQVIKKFSSQLVVKKNIRFYQVILNKINKIQMQ